MSKESRRYVKVTGLILRATEQVFRDELPVVLELENKTESERAVEIAKRMGLNGSMKGPFSVEISEKTTVPKTILHGTQERYGGEMRYVVRTGATHLWSITYEKYEAEEALNPWQRIEWAK